MRNIKITKNPFLLFSPFLVLFIIYVLVFPTKGNEGDEARYLMFANNLIHGFYSPPWPSINLTNGPGYPLIITPFIGLGLPLVSITILNAIFYYLSIIMVYKTLQRIVSYRATLIFSFFWACYYVAYQNMPFTHTETFTYLLVSILIYCLIRAFEPGSPKQIKKYVILSGLTLGYLVLTKIAFGWVLLFMVGGTVLFWLFNRAAANCRKALIITLIGFATVTPYLVYTHHLTGRFFYWSTNSGGSLYWSTSPYKGEYGDWKLDLKQHGIDMGNYNIAGSTDSLVAHHQADYDEIFKYNTEVEQDDAFKRIAIRNIKAHPLKYLENCMYNVGRLIFHYPFSQAVQRPKILLVFPINGIILTFMLFCLIPTIKNWRKLDYPIRFLLIFTFLYLGESSMVTALVRMFTVIVPVLMIWFAYIFDLTVKINFHINRVSPKEGPRS